MQIKKEVIRKRLLKKIAALELEEKKYDERWPKYQKELLEYYQYQITVVKKSKSQKQYNASKNKNMPSPPYMPYERGESLRRAKRNLAILEAIDGDVIDVEQLRTGKNFSIGNLFDEEF
jgi:hypothetical protein